MKRQLLSVAALSAAAFAAALPTASFAVVAAPDTTDATTYIETNGPTVLGDVGSVMVIISSVAILWKWAKAAIFG
jgi:hypothetical protein